MLKPPFYVISDTHWQHKNIIRYCNRDENHNRIMIDRWNKTIGPQDTILHLGDLFMTKNEKKRNEFIYGIAPILNGRKFLILGNHDYDKASFYEDLGFKVIRPFNMRYRGWDVSFDHYPTAVGLIERGERYIRVHGHIHNSGYQHIRAKHKERRRYGNVNVSVEVIDYTPQPIERVLDKAIDEFKPKQNYINVNSKRNGTKQENRHAA